MKTKYFIASAVCLFFLSCQKEQLELSQPKNNTSTFSQSSIYNKENPNEEVTPATPEAELANYAAWYENPYQLTDFIISFWL